jgi:hypothetical protein
VDRLGGKGLIFWSHTFKYISHASEIWEENMTNITMLPLFGGIISHKANVRRRAKWLSIFNEQNHTNRTIFHNYKIVLDIYNEKNINRIDHPVTEGLTS